MTGPSDNQRIQKACEDEAFQAALQRYAHANGSSMAIMQAAARALAATEDPATEIASLKQSLAEAEGQIRHLEQRLSEATEIIKGLVGADERYIAHEVYENTRRARDFLAKTETNNG